MLDEVEMDRRCLDRTQQVAGCQAEMSLKLDEQRKLASKRGELAAGDGDDVRGAIR